MSFWSKLGKIALKVGGVGAMFIPGLQPLGAAALGAGLGAASGALDGGGVKGALTGAAFGAIPGAASGVLKSAGVLTGTGLGTRLAKVGLSAASKGAVGSLAGGGGGGPTVLSNDAGSAGEDGNVWDPEGNYIGPSSISTSDGAADKSWWSQGDNALKVADVAQGAIGAYLRTKATKDAAKQQAALYESNLDPYRNLEDQTSATGRFDMQANAPFTAPPTTFTSKYRGVIGGDIQPGPSWLPSPTTRGVANLAMDQAAAGRGRAPSMTDTSNYGTTASVSYPGPRTAPPIPVGAGQTPAAAANSGDPLLMLARIAARRRLQPPAAGPMTPGQSWLA